MRSGAIYPLRWAILEIMSTEPENIKPENMLVLPKENPLLKDLSPHLKDPNNYDKLKYLINKTLAGNCEHRELIEWAKCPKCQKRFYEKRKLLDNLGFTSPAQYRKWVETHEHIKKLKGLKSYHHQPHFIK